MCSLLIPSTSDQSYTLHQLPAGYELFSKPRVKSSLVSSTLIFPYPYRHTAYHKPNAEIRQILVRTSQQLTSVRFNNRVLPTLYIYYESYGSLQVCTM